MGRSSIILQAGFTSLSTTTWVTSSRKNEDLSVVVDDAANAVADQLGDYLEINAMKDARGEPKAPWIRTAPGSAFFQYQDVNLDTYIEYATASVVTRLQCSLFNNSLRDIGRNPPSIHPYRALDLVAGRLGATHRVRVFRNPKGSKRKIHASEHSASRSLTPY